MSKELQLVTSRQFDGVRGKGEVGFIFGRRAKGSFLVKCLDGRTISAHISYKKLKLIKKRQTFLVERRVSVLPSKPSAHHSSTTRTLSNGSGT